MYGDSQYEDEPCNHLDKCNPCYNGQRRNKTWMCIMKLNKMIYGMVHV